MQVVQSVDSASKTSRFLDGRRGVALLLAGAAVVLAAASFRPLTHSELRYVEAGREMVESGDWVVPHLSYVPYFEKPILAYWLEAASQLAFGMGAIAVRLPMILACVGMTWTTYAFGRCVRGHVFGLAAGAVLVSSVVFQELGPAPLTDTLFAAFLAFSWYAFWRHDREPTPRWIWAFWVALGFAMLTKGPLALVLAGTAIGAYLLLAGRFLDFFRRAKPVLGTVVIAAINAPWWGAVSRRDPRYVWFFFVRENWEAFFSGKVNHPGPPWYYVPWTVTMLFPFAVLGAWAVGFGVSDGLAPALRRRREAIDPWKLYLACMFAAPFLFLSASASKLGTYLLPLFPAGALFLATYVADRLAAPNRPMRRATLAQGVVLLVAAAAAPFAVARIPAAKVLHGNEVPVAIAVAALVLPMIAGGLAMFRGRVVRGMTIVAAGGFVGVLVVNAVAPRLGVEAEAFELVARMKEVRKSGEDVILPSPVVDDYAIVLSLRERPYIFGKASELGMGHFTECTASDVPFPKTRDAKGEERGIYDVGGEIPLPQNKWLLDLAALRAKWKGPTRVWFVGRKKDVEWLAENGFAPHVFATKDDTTVATNKPLDER